MTLSAVSVTAKFPFSGATWMSTHELGSQYGSFAIAEGLTWRLGDRTRTETDLREWVGERGQVGRMPPNGFPRSLKF